MEDFNNIVTLTEGGDDKITLSGAASLSSGKTTANIFIDGGILNSAGTAVTLNSSTETYTATSKIVTIDASSKTFSTEDQFIHGDKSVTIPAAFNPQKNLVVTIGEDISVIDAHFSAKNLNLATKNDNGVSIRGGTKNDTLTGGADTFIYGKVTGKFNKAGTELTVKVGKTDVAVLKDFGDTSTFNVTANGKIFALTK